MFLLLKDSLILLVHFQLLLSFYLIQRFLVIEVTHLALLLQGEGLALGLGPGTGLEK